MLPSLDKPKFTCILPSDKREVKFVPFTVKQEKILLMAIESKTMSKLRHPSRSQVLRDYLD